MEQDVHVTSSQSGSAQGRRLVRPILLELAPLVSFSCAYLLALWVFGVDKHYSVSLLLLVFAVGFAVSGLGWFSIGERGWGWKILGARLLVVVAAFAMGTVLTLAGLSYIGCESRCSDDTSFALSAGFVSATIAVWIVALASPVVSAVALAIWLRRHRVAP